MEVASMEAASSADLTTCWKKKTQKSVLLCGLFSGSNGLKISYQDLCNIIEICRVQLLDIIS